MKHPIAGSRRADGPRRSGRLHRIGGIAVAVAVAFALVPGTAADATPARGNSGWSVLLCKFSDVSTQPHTPAFFQRMFGSAGVGQGGLYDYYLDQSYGKIKINASVQGWYTMPFTKAQEAPKSRWDKITDCVTTAQNAGYTVPAGNLISAITNSQQDSGSSGGRVLLDPGAWNIRFAAHEMGHAYGLGHSFSNDLTYQNAPWSAPGEYDDMWDEMSAQHVYSFATSSFGEGGVGLNAFDRDELGWLPKDRVLTFGANGVASAAVTLAPLQVPGAAGLLLVRVPFDPGDLFHYYTVEFQRQIGWSRGIPGDAVLIHEVQNGRPTLLRQLAVPGKPPVQSLSANGVSINVNWVNGNAAGVSISSDIVTRCVQGYVWREAGQGDVVCVTGATRSQAAYDNSVAATRWVPGPYGPHTCIQGYVWREAFVGDDVCVTGDVRSQAAADNAQAALRSNPARSVYGPSTCQPGYVWRDGDLSDYVCVTGATRAQALYDNSVKTTRWVSGPYGPHTCVYGYVWRGAWPGDDVCVTGANRALAAYDDSQVGARVMRPGG